MKEFGLLFGLMVIGSGLVFFLKGVLDVRSKPEDFRFVDFIAANANRLALLTLGLVFAALALFLDPVGLSEIMKQLPGGVQVASPLVAGAALAGAVLILPQNRTDDE